MNGPISAYRRYWLPELAALATVAAATTVLFATTDLDLAAARLFYRAGDPDPWPAAARFPWSVLYRSAPWVTASLALAGVGAVAAGFRRAADRRFRLYGLLVLSSVAIGPGLIVNGILKDHWGRPRPRQVVQFGGPLEYAPPLIPTAARGKSFPCGHCSVGYLYGIGWWVWRRRRPRLAAASLAAGAVAGTLLGIGRMAAGAHFLSDAVWAGLIAWGVAHAVHYYLLRIPAREDRRDDAPTPPAAGRGRRRAAVAGTLLVALAVVAGGLLASPSDRDLSARIPLAGYPSPLDTLEIVADRLDVEILIAPEPPGEIACSGAVHGFGPPTNSIDASWTFAPHPAPTLRFRVAANGLFTDLDGSVRIRLPPGAARRIVVRVGRGNVAVAPDGSAGRPLPLLDLRTGDGRVTAPPSALDRRDRPGA